MPKIERPEKYEWKCDRCGKSEFADARPHWWAEYAIPGSTQYPELACVHCDKCLGEVLVFARGQEPKTLARAFGPIVTNGESFTIPNPTPIRWCGSDAPGEV